MAHTNPGPRMVLTHHVRPNETSVQHFSFRCANLQFLGNCEDVLTSSSCGYFRRELGNGRTRLSGEATGQLRAASNSHRKRSAFSLYPRRSSAGSGVAPLSRISAELRERVRLQIVSQRSRQRAIHPMMKPLSVFTSLRPTNAHTRLLFHSNEERCL